MGYVALLVSLILLIYSFRNNKGKLIMPKTLFYLLWTFILFLSVLNLYDIIKPSPTAYFLIMLMLIFYFLGDYLANKGIKQLIKENKYMKFIKMPIIIKENIQKIKKSKVSSIIKEQTQQIKKIIILMREKYNQSPKYKIIYIISAIYILFALIDCYIVIKNLIEGVPLYTIRRWRMGTFGVDDNPILSRRTFVEEVFRSVILTPFEMLIPPIAAYSFFNNNEKKANKYSLLILSIVILLSSSIAGGGGRLGFIYYFGCFLLVFLISIKDNKIDMKKNLKYLIIILILGFSATFVITTMRTSHGFIKQVYTYFALPPTLLSLWLPKISELPHTYGLLTSFGIHSYIFRGLDAIGLDFLVPTAYNNVFQHILNAEKFMQVGYGVGNAFVTPIYYFMIDGGIPFICIASMFFGYIISKIYNRIINKINMKNFVIYALIMYGIFVTFIRVQIIIPSYVISIIFAIILLDVVEEKNKKERSKKK